MGAEFAREMGRCVSTVRGLTSRRLAIALVASARPEHAIVSLKLPRAALEVEVYDPATGERAGTATLSRIPPRADSIFVGVARTAL